MFSRTAWTLLAAGTLLAGCGGSGGGMAIGRDYGASGKERLMVPPAP